MDNEKASEIVKALLARTMENGCTQAEAEAASVKATEYIDKYNIQFIDMVQKAHVHDLDTTMLRMAPYYGICANLFADAYECKALLAATPGETIIIRWVGLQLDTETAAFLYLVFMNIFEGMSKPRKHTAKSEFILGACKAVVERLRDKRNNIARGLVVRKKELIDDYLKGRQLGRSKRHTVTMSQAYSDGVEFGKSVNLHSNLR